MKTDQDFKIVVEVPLVGKIGVQAELDPETFHLVYNEVTTSSLERSKFHELNLRYLIESDVEGFKKLSEAGDDRHKINVDSMKVHYVEISGNFIRVHYIFDQFGDDACWRMCAGNMTHFTSLDRIYENGYGLNCVVYW